MDTIAKANNLSLGYGASQVLEGLSFSLPRGAFIGIVGPNGAGKSTLLKAFANELTPSSGSLELMTTAVAYIPQVAALQWDMPLRVLDVVILGSRKRWIWGLWPKRTEKAKALQMLDAMGLAELALAPISELSGGQRQRLLLAKALMEEADLWLLDEPFAAVDAASQRKIVRTLKDFVRDHKKTIISVHHPIGDWKELFDYLVLLNKRLIIAGPTLEVLSGPYIARAYGECFAGAIRGH